MTNYDQVVVGEVWTIMMTGGGGMKDLNVMAKLNKKYTKRGVQSRHTSDIK